MKKIVFLVFLVALFSCNARNQINHEISVQNFKDRTLEKCLYLGYEDKNLIKQIYTIDRSVYKPLAIAIYDEPIKTFLIPKINKIKKDSIESINIISEGKSGKIVFDNCLKIYKSKELNIVAKKQMKEYRKIKDIDSLVNIKNPSY